MAHPRFLLGGIAAAFLAILSTAAAYGAGVTVITHGFQPVGLAQEVAPAWLNHMASAIVQRAVASGLEVTVYRLRIQRFAQPSMVLLAGPLPSASNSGEILVILDWADVSDPFTASSVQTDDVAALVLPFFL